MARREAGGQRVDRGSVLLSVARLVGEPVDLDHLLSRVMEAVIRAMDADRGTLFLLDRARGEIWSRAGRLPPGPEIRLPVGTGIAGHVARTGETVNVPDPSQDPRFHGDVDRLTGYRTRSILAAPVKDGAGELLGVLELLNKRGVAWSPADAAMLRALASQVAMVLEGTSLRGRIRAGAPAAPTLGYNGIVGASPALLDATDRIARVAATDVTVLLRGETGTGKGLVARAIHGRSARRDGPFVTVDCGALPPTLIENELFGHERGAFTGADRASTGKIEAASGGTVFLDEIAELPLPVQAKLLRLLQEREIERIGSTRAIAVDARVIAATHRDLEDLVARGLFREDLYYRIRVVTLGIPPLRERGAGDIELLARHFLDVFARRHRRTATLGGDALARLAAHRWPGNVRELENCIEGALILAKGGEIGAADLALPSPRRAGPGALGELTFDEMERAYAEAVMAASGGNKSDAARRMGVSRTTLLRMLARHRLDRG